MKRDVSLFERLLVRLATARVFILFVFHAIVFTAAFAFSYLVRFEFSIPGEHLAIFQTTAALVVAMQLLVGLFFGFYRGWWRYVGLADVVRLVFGLSTATAILVMLWYVGERLGLDPRFTRAPRGVLLIDWAFSLLALFGTRLLIRLGRDRFRPHDMPDDKKHVVIIGAGDAGETLAREIEHRPQLGMKVVAFVDDQRAKWGAHIRGIRVTGPIANIASIADEADADQALLAIPSATGSRLREIVRHLSEADLTFKTIPGIDHLVSGKVHVSQLRAVNIEDLMRRKRIELPGDPVRELFKDKRVLVTGAGGTIGEELALQILQLRPKKLLLLERSEYALYETRKRLARNAMWPLTDVAATLLDIRDTAAVDAFISRESPDLVLHAAAHKHVPLGEENPAEYVRNNTLASLELADLCARQGVERFVFISTDKAINPSSVMGATKRAAEVLLLDLTRRCDMKLTIVRFGNVIGSSGSVVPLFMEQIAAGGPVTVTHPDVTRYFIRTSEAIALVLQAATLGADRDVLMLDMGEPVKVVDLARDLIRLSNHTEDQIPIVFTGLRAGEKLFEEITLSGETIRPTAHPQIVVTEAPQPEPSAIAAWLSRMNRPSIKTRGEVLSALRDLVPEFIDPASAAQADAVPDAAPASLTPLVLRTE